MYQLKVRLFFMINLVSDFSTRGWCDYFPIEGPIVLNDNLYKRLVVTHGWRDYYPIEGPIVLYEKLRKVLLDACG